MAEEGKRTRRTKPAGNPNFPYTKTAGALKTFLSLVQGKPKPPTVDRALLKSWGIKDNNAYTIIKPLTLVGLLSSSGVPTAEYAAYMNPTTGKATLGSLVRTCYQALFAVEHEPHKDDATVKNLFNIHGGTDAATTLKYMRDTFTTFCEASDLSTNAPLPQIPGTPPITPPGSPQLPLVTPPGAQIPSSAPTVAINIQLTLPEGMDADVYEQFFSAMKNNLFPD